MTEDPKDHAELPDEELELILARLLSGESAEQVLSSLPPQIKEALEGSIPKAAPDGSAARSTWDAFQQKASGQAPSVPTQTGGRNAAMLAMIAAKSSKPSDDD